MSAKSWLKTLSIRFDANRDTSMFRYTLYWSKKYAWPPNVHVTPMTNSTVATQRMTPRLRDAA